MMMGGQEDANSGMLADINITPLVDVMLVLMIIFMVTAPLLVPQSLDIHLPQTTDVRSPQSLKKDRLTIGASGRLQINGHTIADELLPQHFKTQIDDENYTLSIEADEQVRYGRVAEVLAIARAANVSKISFITTVAR